MASERLVITVTERGAKVVSGNIKNIGTQARTSAGGVNLLRRALLAVGGAVVIRQLARVSDEFTNLNNRLRIVTDSEAELVAVRKELLQVSNETRTVFQTNAELFTRTAIATRELGLSQKQVITFTKALGQATILSGASAIEANNAIRQLSQGLQSGELRGEEFRSVSEQLPIVLDILSEQLGVTRGELRELAFDGKLTADVLVGGLLRAAEDLDEQFRTTTPTIAQAANVLRNNFVNLIGEFNEASGIAQAVARSFLFLADNIGTVARVLAAGGIAIAIQAITSAVISLTAAIATNPLGALATAAALAVGALVTFGDQIQLTSEGLANFQDLAVVTFQVFSEIFVNTFNTAATVLESFIGNFNTTIRSNEGAIIRFVRTVAQGIDNIVALFQGLKDAIAAALSDLPNVLADIFFRALNGVVALVESFLNKIVEGINLVTGLTGIELPEANLGRLTNSFEAAGKAVGEAFVRGFSQGGAGAEQLLDDILGAAESRAQARLSRTALEEFQRGQAGAQLGEGGVDVATLGRDSGDGAEARDVFSGFRKGLETLTDEVTDFATLAEDTLVNAFRGAEDAFVDFVTTGEADFKGLVDSILRDLVRLAARQALVGLLSSEFGGPAGGAANVVGGAVSGGFGGGRQSGGPINPGQSFLVGERGPEMIVPQAPGQVVPLQPQAPPVVNVVNVTDPKDVTQGLNTPEGEEVVLNIIRRNREGVKNSLS